MRSGWVCLDLLKRIRVKGVARDSLQGGIVRNTGGVSPDKLRVRTHIPGVSSAVRSFFISFSFENHNSVIPLTRAYGDLTSTVCNTNRKVFVCGGHVILRIPGMRC